jgi:hypothetical protein
MPTELSPIEHILREPGSLQLEENHLNRNKRVGLPVMINETWY